MQRSRLHVEAAARWESDATKLPTRKVAQPGIDADLSHLDYDHCFEGWRGPARIRDERFSLQLVSELPYLVVYTPPERDYFCVEPVSHLSNAIHMAEPAAHGLRRWRRGDARGGDAPRHRRRLEGSAQGPRRGKRRVSPIAITVNASSASPRCAARRLRGRAAARRAPRR